MQKFISLLCALLFLNFAGCDWFFPDDDDDDDMQSHSITDTYTWPAQDYIGLDIGTVNGDITAGAVFGSDITVTITRRVSGPDANEVETRIDDITIDTTSTEGQLIITAAMPLFDDYDYRADFDILAPPDLPLIFATINGKVSTDGFSAGFSLTTGVGDILVQNQNGAINATAGTGNLNCELLSLPPDADVVMATILGNVNLHLPADVSAHFAAYTEIGTVRLFGFDNVTYINCEQNDKSGDIGGGEAWITLDTYLGDITLRGGDMTGY